MLLLERDSQLDMLRRHLDDAAAGDGSLLLVTGEAGIGKTALARAFGSQLPAGNRLLFGSCDPLSTPAAHAPLHDLAADLSPDIVDLLRSRAEPLTLFSAVLSALRTMPGTVIVVEDIHWADEGTLDLLRFLSRRIGSAPALIVVTARNDEPGAGTSHRQFLGELARTPRCERMLLLPLSQDAVASMVGDRPIPADTLHRRTGGNPFYVTELLESEAVLPSSVSDAVLGRWSRLSAGAQSSVQIAALLGPEVEVDIISAVAGIDARAQIEEAIAGGLMRTTAGGVGFRHELARDAIFESITPLRRQAIYRTALHIVPTVRPRADPALLAHYAAGAGDTDAIRQYNTMAAERAAALGANREAALHYQHALATWAGEPVAKRLPLLEGYANAATTCGWSSEELVARTELLEHFRSQGNRVNEANQLRLISACQVLSGRNDEANQAIAQALALLETIPERAVHAQVRAAQAMLMMLNRDNDAAIEMGQRALAVAERFDDRESYARAHNAIGSALIVSGNQAEGVRVLETGIAYASRTGQLRQVVSMRGNLGTASGEMFELDTAESALLRAIDEARNSDLDGQLSYTLSWLALVQLYRGRWEDAVRSAREALDTPHAYGISTMMAWLAIGRVRARRGDPDVWEALDQALRLAEPTGTLQRLAPVSAARAEARWLAGDLDGTTAEARRAYELAVAHRHPWHTGELAYWLRLAGVDAPTPDDAAEPWRLHLAGDYAGAASAWERRGCPYEAARARFESDDIEQMRAALIAFESLDAQPMAANAALRLRAMGASIPRGPRRTTRENPAGLTARELDVLELLAAGSTYAEIGDTLFLSTRTVEHHVSSILRKLGARTRYDAVRAAIERSIIPG